jgi:hypothetical protein
MAAHYNSKKAEQLKSLSMGKQIFAVPKGSALLYTKMGVLSRINRVFLFENGNCSLML